MGHPPWIVTLKVFLLTVSNCLPRDTMALTIPGTVCLSGQMANSMEDASSTGKSGAGKSLQIYIKMNKLGSGLPAQMRNAGQSSYLRRLIMG